VWTGRPDKLAITIGGQEVPPISKVPEIVKNVPISAAALLARGKVEASATPAATPAASPIPGATATPVAATPRPVRRYPRPRPSAEAAPVAATTPSTVTP
jgi:hypothetical protein